MASHEYGIQSRTLDKRVTISGEISASPLIKRAIVDGETLRYLANCRTLIFNSSSHKFLMTYPDVADYAFSFFNHYELYSYISQILLSKR